MKTSFTALVLAAAMVMSLTGSASALECDGNTVDDALATALLNKLAAGFTMKVSKRKQLVVNKVESVSGNKCQIQAKVNVTLKRKVRRDASGHVTVSGTLKPNLAKGELCVDNVKLGKVRVSHTLRIGEAIYRKIGSKALPQNTCFKITDFAR